MNKELVGYSIEDVLDPIHSDDTDAYARAVLDKNPNYQGKNPLVTPFYPSKLFVSMIMKICIMKNLRLNLLKMVHGEQEVIWYHPIRVGDRLKSKVTIAGIQNTPVGEMITLCGQLYFGDKLVLVSNTGFLVRGQKTIVKEEIQQKKEVTELFRLGIQTKEGQQLEYAKASDDNNFIHTNNFLAKMAGLPRTILQGLCILSMSCSALSEKMVSSDINRLESIKGRFSGVVIPGQLLELIAYKGDQSSEILFEIINPLGKIILKKGVFRFKDA
jgi:acyl dehydratase